ncbi:MAG: hypothetical protein ACRENE_09390 [Polyangiaceae bacterium]
MTPALRGARSFALAVSRRRGGPAACAVGLLGLAGVLAAGCSARVQQAGGLEVVIATDMKVPDAFDTLNVEVRQQTSDGSWESPLLSDPYAVRSPSSLPRTVSIQAGSSPDQTVLIDVTARKGGPAGTKVVFREVQVQVPRDRVAELDVWIASVCSGVVDCPAQQSCDPATGACGSNVINATTLPLYDPHRDAMAPRPELPDATLDGPALDDVSAAPPPDVAQDGGAGQESGVGADDAGDDAADGGEASVPEAAPCVGGGACTPDACTGGLLECDGGTLSCVATSTAPNGSLCDAGAVCGQGACNACDNGADCTPTSSCAKKTIDCSSGTAACVAAGNVADGTPCGTNLFCSGGACMACTAGTSCVPTGTGANPCHQGIVSCSAGQVVCTEQPTKNAANGTSCGTNSVCSAGSCVACTANVSCPLTGSPCHIGLTSCATGASVCVDTGNPQLNGTTCDDGNACTQTDTCQGGTCTGSNPVVCSASDQCHVAGTCSTATGTCSNPAATNGTTCTGTNLCNRSYTCKSGTCTGSSPVVCSASDQCHVAGTCSTATGTCSNPAATNGTTCTGTDLCNQTYTCQTGTCTGSNPVTCTGKLQRCQTQACVPSTGMCTVSSEPDGTACSGVSGSWTCSGGNCVCASNTPTLCPGQVCADTSSDAANCGACGHSCLTQTCTSGYCAPVTLGNTASSQGVGIAVSASAVYFTDGPSSASGGHLYTCPLTGCVGAPTVYFGGMNYAAGVSFDASTNYAYVADDNNGYVYIVTGQNTAIQVNTDGSPYRTVTDGTYVYWGDYDGVGRVNKTTGGTQQRVWSAAGGSYVRSVSIDPSTGNVWAISQGSAGLVASCKPDGSGCSTWSVAYPYDVRVIGSTPYIATENGIYTCASTTNCSSPSPYYTQNTGAMTVTFDSSTLYFATNTPYFLDCPLGTCTSPGTLASEGGSVAWQVMDSSNIYWITTSGVVQKIAK